VSDDPQTPEPEAEEGAEGLTDELARKYDPERMLKMVSRSAGKGEQLDYAIRAKYEKRFGIDLGHVRVYTGGTNDAASRFDGTSTPASATVPISSVSHCSTMPKPRNSRSAPSK